MSDALNDREAQRVAFLTGVGLADARRAPLPGDASTRRYERLTPADGPGLMLMDQVAAAESPPADPSWSPDGKLIAYVRRPTAEYELVVKSVNGGSPAVLARTPQRISSISWTPDASRLYYVDSPTRGRLFSVARAGGDPSPASDGPR